MSELEDILEKKQEKKKRIPGSFNVHSEHLAEIMEFVRKHGIQVEKALYDIVYNGPFRESDYYLVRPRIYLLETKYGPIKVKDKFGWYGENRSAEIEYQYSAPEEQEEIKKLFHEEKKLKS